MDAQIFDLGLVDFEQAWQFQKEKFQEVKNGLYSRAFILCRHYPVITLGRSASTKNILASERELARRGIKVCSLERGGDVTYHGPGQLLLYPILNLAYFKKDIRWFMRSLEGLIIGLLLELGIYGQRRAGLTGVWLKAKKIASIGVAIRNWITFHGLALNVAQEDLENFSLIRPCGLDIMMTSVESEIGRNIGIEQIKRILKRRLGNGQSYFA